MDMISNRFVHLLLNTLSIQPNINRLKMNYNIHLKELNISSNQCSIFFNSSNIGFVWSTKLKFNKIESLTIKTLKIYHTKDADVIDNDEYDDEEEKEQYGKTEKTSQVDILADFQLFQNEYLLRITAEKMNKNSNDSSN